MQRPPLQSIRIARFTAVLAAFIFVGEGSANGQLVCYYYGVSDCAPPQGIGLVVSSQDECTSALGGSIRSVLLLDVTGGSETCFNAAPLPVELSSFTATVIDGSVRLEWVTLSETNNAGFEVEHKSSTEQFERLQFVEGAGTSATEKRYSHVIAGLDPGRHVFRLYQIDFDGSVEYSPEVEAEVTTPGPFILKPAYPNPFNPSSSVRFAVQAAQHVTITVFDIRGRRVAVPFDGIAPANEMQAVNVDGSLLPSGWYAVVLAGNGFRASESILLLK